MEKILESQQPKKIEKKEEAKAADGGPTNPVDAALKAIDNIQYESLNKFGWD